MSNTQTIQNFDQAAAYLAAGRDKNDRPGPSGGNTRVQRRDDDTIAVKYHRTDVVTYKRDGSIILDNGGWFTPTTKARITEYTPLGVTQCQGEWSVMAPNPAYDRDAPYVHGEMVDGRYVPAPSVNDGVPYWLPGETVYANGITWHPVHGFTGGLSGDALAQARLDAKRIRRDVKSFVDSITPERIVDALADTGGDCFICRVGDTSCIASHVDENYFHGTLLANAVGNPYKLVYMRSDAERGCVSSDLKRDLGKYMRGALLPNLATR